MTNEKQPQPPPSSTPATGPTALIRMLIVDDEQPLLDALEGRLRPLRKRWQMRFVNSGQEALDLMDQETFDILLCDVRMPGIDGTQVLTQARKQHPGLVRVAMTGNQGDRLALQLVPLAHQVIGKPFDVKALEDVVASANRLRGLITQDRVRDILGQIEELPAAPGVSAKLNAELSKPNVESRNIVEIIQREASLCSKILRVVNSPFIGALRPILDIPHAISFLGLDMLRSLVMSTEIHETLCSQNMPAHFDLAQFQLHQLVTASIARKICKGYVRSEDAFIAGLLHDVGLLLSISHLRELYTPIWKSTVDDEQSLFELEYKILGTSHAELGGYLMSLWGLPQEVVIAAAFHHKPWITPHEGVAIEDIIYVSDNLARRTAPFGSSLGKPAEPLDMNYLAAKGLDVHLSEWEEIANDMQLLMGKLTW